MMATSPSTAGKGTTSGGSRLPDEDRYFRIATPRRAQVLFWFSSYYEKSILPYMEEWKDVTKEVKKRRGEAD